VRRARERGAHLLQQVLCQAVFRVAHHAHKLGADQILEVPVCVRVSVSVCGGGGGGGGGGGSDGVLKLPVRVVRN
jgi:hypothetical protein